MRLMSSHSRQVMLILPPTNLTLQFFPTERGMLHLLQYMFSFGIGVLVFWLMRLAMDMYLFALSLLPSLAAFTDSLYSADIRFFAMLEASREEMRFLDISNASEPPNRSQYK